MVEVRRIAICVFRNADRILVSPGYDDVTGEHFFRPLGGGIESGERADEALRREIREELGLEINSPIELGVIDNHFCYRGKPGHELVSVFDASFTDARVYARAAVPVREDGWSGPAQWLSLSGPLPCPLYPEGLGALLQEASGPAIQPTCFAGG